MLADDERVLGRGEVVLARNGAVRRLETGRVPLMLAANGVRTHDGTKQLNAHLTGEQRAVLEALPPLTAARSAVLAFDRAVAAEVISRGRTVAGLVGAGWPADLEAATLRYLDRELGSAFL